MYSVSNNDCFKFKGYNTRSKRIDPRTYKMAYLVSKTLKMYRYKVSSMFNTKYQAYSSKGTKTPINEVEKELILQYHLKNDILYFM